MNNPKTDELPAGATNPTPNETPVTALIPDPAWLQNQPVPDPTDADIDIDSNVPNLGNFA